MHGIQSWHLQFLLCRLEGRKSIPRETEGLAHVTVPGVAGTRAEEAGEGRLEKAGCWLETVVSAHLFPSTPPALPFRTPGGAGPTSTALALPVLDTVEAAAQACLFFISFFWFRAWVPKQG